MTIWTVLISRDWYYLWENGELPKRLKWDKEFITWLIKGRNVLCSENTYKSLPKSIIDSWNYFTCNPISNEWEINFWIDTFKTTCDLFILIKSNEYLWWWKLFRVETLEELYIKTIDTENITLYIKK